MLLEMVGHFSTTKSTTLGNCIANSSRLPTEPSVLPVSARNPSNCPSLILEALQDWRIILSLDGDSSAGEGAAGGVGGANATTPGEAAKGVGPPIGTSSTGLGSTGAEGGGVMMGEATSGLK